jgi:TPR repeat protein
MKTAQLAPYLLLALTLLACDPTTEPAGQPTAPPTQAAPAQPTQPATPQLTPQQRLDEGVTLMARNTPAALTQAADLFQTSCDEGLAAACNNLGALYMLGRGVGKDEARALTLFKKACEGKDRAACDTLGELYSRDSSPSRDLALATSSYAAACELGFLPSCARLGSMYDQGSEAAKDDARAAALYEQACVHDIKKACGDMNTVAVGQGVASGDELASAQGSCSAKLGAACGNLAVMYRSGRGVAKDVRKATTLYSNACLYNALSCDQLGALYLVGEGDLPADPAKALPLLNKGCEGGVASSCNNLGVCYNKGLGGLTRDAERAAAMFKRACDAGLDDACANLKRLNP